MSTQAASSPTAGKERYELIDIVRGFALFGVLLANIVWTTQEMFVPWEHLASLPTASFDRVVGAGVELFIDGKFYTLFSVLFGLGFAMQLQRAEQRGRNVLPAYRRRLLILFLIGAVHSILVWFGDVLHVYALLGFLLLPIRRCSDRVILLMALVVALMVPTASIMEDYVLGNEHEHESKQESNEETNLDQEYSSDSSDFGKGDDEEEPQRFLNLKNGNWLDVIRVNWKIQRDDYGSLYSLLDNFVYWYLEILWRFLIGFVIGRRMWLQNSSQHLGLFRRVLPWALIYGLLTNACSATSFFGIEALEPNGNLSESLVWILLESGIPILSLAYLCGLALLYQREAWRRRLQWLAPVGRMALTNYLTHSLLFVLLFFGPGLSLLGEVGASGCLAISVAIFALQIALSVWWLRRFRFGPTEWAWRCLTYGKRQPFRRANSRPADPLQ